MDISLTEIIKHKHPTPIEITQKILRNTIKTTGQYITLCLVCKSWQDFCKKDIFIANNLSKSKTFNTNVAEDIFNSTNREKPSDKDISNIIQSPLFDIRFEMDKTSAFKYAVLNENYHLFEVLLVHPYTLIRPTILKIIIEKADTKFVDLLKKHSFNFGRYNFSHKQDSYTFYGESVPLMEVTVFYAEKPYPLSVDAKPLLQLIQETIRCNQLKKKRFDKGWRRKIEQHDGYNV
jgi:hypothetical protein